MNEGLLRISTDRMKVVTGLLLCSVTAIAGALAAPSTADHPILGIWTFILPDSGCSETYEFRADGTLLASSGEERSARIYQITEVPDAQGFYTLVDRVVRENGKLDCFGEPTELGFSATIFIHFDPTGSSFAACETKSADVCIGPFRRVRRIET
jgi:hypothetical protein